MRIVTGTEAPTKQNGQSFKNKSNSLCPGRAELKIKKRHTVHPKRNEKTEPVLIAANNSGICLTKNFMK